MDHLKVILNYNPNNSTSSSVDLNLQTVRANYAFEEEPIIVEALHTNDASASLQNDNAEKQRNFLSQFRQPRKLTVEGLCRNNLNVNNKVDNNSSLSVLDSALHVRTNNSNISVY